ncbi:MAG: phytanoyl-CoA dioxygenase family protein, partial [Fibrobacterota bacterium]|nr:phytanoyl-CoA dioxygenase family protein [Fibrobacterota bacterium]
ENGCLQLLKGSHHLGRLDHVLTGEQAGADAERVREAVSRLELVHCEMEPGDTVFFHCNTLHRSDANRSMHPRWAMICCYNAARNDPFADSQHPRYTPLHKVEDSALREIGGRTAQATGGGAVGWLEKDRDGTARKLQAGVREMDKRD